MLTVNNRQKQQEGTGRLSLWFARVHGSALDSGQPEPPYGLPEPLTPAWGPRETHNLQTSRGGGWPSFAGRPPPSGGPVLPENSKVS